jgi:serine/threonine protein kinase
VAYWNRLKLTPSKELQDLFTGMLQEDPSKRWTVQQIIDCPWMMNQEVPDPIEVSFEAYRVITLLKD